MWFWIMKLEWSWRNSFIMILLQSFACYNISLELGLFYISCNMFWFIVFLTLVCIYNRRKVFGHPCLFGFLNISSPCLIVPHLYCNSEILITDFRRAFPGMCSRNVVRPQMCRPGGTLEGPMSKTKEKEHPRICAPQIPTTWDLDTWDVCPRTLRWR